MADFQDQFHMCMLVDREENQSGFIPVHLQYEYFIRVLTQTDPGSGGSEAAGLTGSFHQWNLQFIKLQLCAKEVLTLQDFLPIKIHNFKELVITHFKTVLIVTSCSHSY